jgi:hypothetical protein
LDGGSGLPHRVRAINEGCAAIAHGGSPPADLIHPSAVHFCICFTRETIEEFFSQQSAFAGRETERFLRDHFNSKSHASKLLSASLKIKSLFGRKWDELGTS